MHAHYTKLIIKRCFYVLICGGCSLLVHVFACHIEDLGFVHEERVFILSVVPAV